MRPLGAHAPHHVHQIPAQLVAQRWLERTEFPRLRLLFEELIEALQQSGITVERDCSFPKLTDRSLYLADTAPDPLVLLYADVPKQYRYLARPHWDDGPPREFAFGYHPRCQAAAFAHSKLNGVPQWDRFHQCDYPAWDDSLRCYLHREGRVVDLATYQREFLGRTLTESAE